MAPFAAFKQLSEPSRALLMAELPSNQHSSLPEIFKTPQMVMLRACRAGQTQVVREMLDMGFSADYIGDISTNSYMTGRVETVIPLSWASESDKYLDLIDLLLERGANPNTVWPGGRLRGGESPMHDACASPDTLRKLIAKGGDVGLRFDDGWGVLDHWVWFAHSVQKNQEKKLIEALEVLLEHGISHKLMSENSFLVECWASGFLRHRIKRFIDMGFDPNERGSGKKSVTLMEHLAKKVKAGKGGALAAELVSSYNAQILSDATPLANAKTSKPRL